MELTELNNDDVADRNYSIRNTAAERAGRSVSTVIIEGWSNESVRITLNFVESVMFRMRNICETRERCVRA